MNEVMEPVGGIVGVKRVVKRRHKRDKITLNHIIGVSKKTGLMIPIIVCAAIFCASVIGHGAVDSMVNTVTISRDGVVAQIETFDTTVEDVMEHTGITLGANDRVTPPLDTVIGEDTVVTVERAMEVTVVDGEEEPQKVVTYNGTVEEMLESQDIEVGAQDTLNASPESNVVNGMTVKIDRITKEQETRTEEVPFETEYQQSSDLYKGEEKVTQEGTAGVRTIVEEITYKNGEETVRTQISNEITTAPVNRVIVQGTKDKPAPQPAVTAEANTQTGASEGSGDNTVTLPDGSVVQVKAVISGESTAYTHTGNRTATGVWPSVGTVSVDPKVIPLGSRLYITGYGYGVAQDTGGAIKGNRVDVFLDTYDACIQWGRRAVTIYVLD